MILIKRIMLFKMKITKLLKENGKMTKILNSLFSLIIIIKSFPPNKKESKSSIITQILKDIQNSF